MKLLVAILIAFSLASCQECPAKASGSGLVVTATSYSWREAQHHRYGRLNALGYDLDDTQIAADWNYYRPGAVIWIQGLGFRTVTDRGRAVTGPRHIDIHFNSLAAMRAWGTRRVRIRILGRRRPRKIATSNRPFIEQIPAPDRARIKELESIWGIKTIIHWTTQGWRYEVNL